MSAISGENTKVEVTWCEIEKMSNGFVVKTRGIGYSYENKRICLDWDMLIDLLRDEFGPAER